MQGLLISVTPTIDTSAYSSGDHLGTLHTIAGVNYNDNKAMGILEGVVIVDNAQQKSALDIFLFASAPTIASSDNGAADISDAESDAKCIGHIVVAATDYRDIGSRNSIACLRNLNMRVAPAALGTIYAFVVSRGSPTYAAATDLTFKYFFDWR